MANKSKNEKSSVSKQSKESSKETTTNKTNPEQLFPTIESKNGHKKTIYGTNDTVEMLKPIPSVVVQERLTDVLDAVRELDRTCDYQKCRTKISLMSMDCQHCNRRYCFKHGLPEVHGCTEAARKQAHNEFQHPKPARVQQSERDLQKAHERMQRKLKDMSLARKAKPSTGSGKKKK